MEYTLSRVFAPFQLKTVKSGSQTTYYHLNNCDCIQLILIHLNSFHVSVFFHPHKQKKQMVVISYN